MRLIALALALTLTTAAAAQDEGPRIVAPEAVLAGDSPHIRLEGLTPGERVRLHGLRRERGAWVQDTAGQWSQGEVTLDAWGDFTVDADGRVDLDTAQPLSGSYRQPDGQGLIWSGYRVGDNALNAVEDERLYGDVPAGPLSLVLLRGEDIAAEARVRLATQRGRMTFVTVSQPGLTGVFAAPEGAVGLPVILQLHGSEGGSLDGARTRAIQFASRGYATLAINYFSWLDEDPLTPRDHIETPIELIQAARDWLATRPEADVERFGVYGASKGAEFSLVAAQRYAWIDAVVACVPTDVVWEGYGREQWTAYNRSSWSFGGEPLPYVPLYPTIDPAQGDRDNTGRYDRSLRELGDADGRARIVVEDIEAQVLLLGSDRDEVWASGPMIRRLVARAEAAGTADRIEHQIYPTAGHAVCGTGGFPARLYADQSSNPWVRDITAEGEASIDGWRRTLDFLERVLGPSHVF